MEIYLVTLLSLINNDIIVYCLLSSAQVSLIRNPVARQLLCRVPTPPSLVHPLELRSLKSLWRKSFIRAILWTNDSDQPRNQFMSLRNCHQRTS